MIKHFLLILSVFIATSSAFAQTSITDGTWESNATWNTASPGITNINRRTITVGHKVYAGTGTYSGLTFSTSGGGGGPYILTVNDTLIIYGNVTFSSNSMDLVINNCMIVIGNLTLENKTDINSGGTLVVTGTIDKNGGTGSYSGTGTVYAGGYDSGADSYFPGDTGTDGDQQQTIGDLTTDNTDGSLTDIIEFIDSGGAVPLPVTLGSFTALTQKRTVNLQWTTLAEKDFEYFEVRRGDADGVFQSMGRLNAQGTTNSPTDYFWSDERPLVGVNFYQLVAHDLDGSFEEFAPIVVMFEPKDVSFRAYPNPAPAQSQIRFDIPGGQYKITIFDMDGQKLGNYEMSTDSMQLPASLTKGIYLLKIEFNGLTRNQRLIID